MLSKQPLGSDRPSSSTASAGIDLRCCGANAGYATLRAQKLLGRAPSRAEGPHGSRGVTGRALELFADRRGRIASMAEPARYRIDGGMWLVHLRVEQSQPVAAASQLVDRIMADPAFRKGMSWVIE